MKRTALFAALCTLGTLMALPASAHDSDRGRRHQWSQHRDHDRHWGHERRPRHFDRRDRYDRHHRYSPRWGEGRSHYAPRGRYCHDSRHFHGVHYHFAPRDWYGHDYERYGYRRHGVYGPDASLIVTLPLF